MDVDKIISWSDDLVSILNDDANATDLAQYCQVSDALRDSCDSQFWDSQALLQDFERRIRELEEETAKARFAISDDKMDSLRREYEAKLENERLLEVKLSVILKEMDDLECERTTIEEHERGVKKLERLRGMKNLEHEWGVPFWFPIRMNREEVDAEDGAHSDSDSSSVVDCKPRKVLNLDLNLTPPMDYA